MDNGKIKGGRAPSALSACWSNRTNAQRKWMKLVAIVVALSAMALVLFAFFYEKHEICTSSGCVRAAEDILEYINLKADPCNDFYSFACGKFMRDASLDYRGIRTVKNVTQDEIQEQIRVMLEEPTAKDDPVAFNQAKKFYGACMNESAIEAQGLDDIVTIFDKIGGWPTLHAYRWDTEFNWKTAVHVLRALGVDFDFFFRVNVEVDPENPQRHILAIHHPYYSPSEISPNVKNMYLEYMVDVVVQFKAKREVAKKDQLDVLNFLLSLAQLSEEANPSNDPPLRLHISELQKQIYSMNWVQYLDGVLRTAFVSEQDVVLISSLSYLKKLLVLLGNTPKRTLANFVSWHTLQHLINYMPSTVLDRAYEYLRKVNGKVLRKSRWSSCIKSTEDRLYPAVAAAYIEHYFDYDLIGTRVLRLIHDIKHQIKTNFKHVDWLDEESKKKSLEALNSGVEEIITLQDLLQTLSENKIYDEVEVDGGKFLQSALRLSKEQLNHHYRQLHKEVRENWLSKRGFIMSLDVVYLPKENILRFPNGLFQGAYYRPDRPEYMNYGGLGTVAAHEISHIFMDSEAGDLYGRNMRSWWSIRSMERYAEKLTCLSQQYSSFSVPEAHRPLNPGRTGDEDMADLAGMKVAYDAYVNFAKTHGREPGLPGLPFSPRQLFWISAARQHCAKYSAEVSRRLVEGGAYSPEHFRVNGPLQNIDEFSHDFECRLGTNMNPEKKCYIW